MTGQVNADDLMMAVLAMDSYSRSSAGALVIGSRTSPVEEMITDGRNGVLCDFFDVASVANAVVAGIACSTRQLPLRAEARLAVSSQYDLARVSRPAWLRLIGASAMPAARPKLLIHHSATRQVEAA